MLRIKELAPEVGRVDLDGLRRLDPSPLVRCAVDPAEPWWRRTACVEALAGRVPEAGLGELFACVRDTADSGTVRKALLGLLSDRPELLPWLRDEARSAEQAYGMPEAVLAARGRLGDLTATAELATLAFSHWRHRREIGETGLDLLVERHGRAAVLGELAGGGRPEDRAASVLLRYAAGEDVIDALADPDPAVAHRAQSLLADPDRLAAYLAAAPTVDAALWAAYALHRLTGDAARTREVYEALGRPRVEVEGLDEEVRRAIVREYALECEKQSDPRWRIEGLCAGAAEPGALVEPVDEEGQLALATAALNSAGLAPRTPVSCGDDHRQGGGTYHVIRYGDGGRSELYISTLGRFAGDHEDAPAARAALEAAGFRWIDAATGSVRVTGLGVYYFGAREPLDVHTLLFYWQD
ncbi:hypothetical protein [Streptomyces sp. NPDC047014]|uniref:hypothetical protein n=1 Tax=Streptomyces sp. NPDC047014 TaxID=3155736 RepID=UPI00340D894B